MSPMAIAGPSALVTDVAAQIADGGGSVVDVAIAASLTAMCTEPGVCAPGGGGFLTVSMTGEAPVVIDGYMAFPGIGSPGPGLTRSVTMDYGGGVTTLVDAGSVGVPGAFAAFDAAWRRHGRMPWAEIMSAVARVVETGFPLSESCHTYLLDSGEPIFGHDPAARSALFDGGTIRSAGDTVLFDGLGASLRAIGDEGADLLYRGELGSVIVEDLTSRGGLLTREDMSRYRPLVRTPLEMGLHGWSIATNPPPAVGGVTVAGALAGIAAADDPLDPTVWHDCLARAFRLRVDEIETAQDRVEASRRVLTRLGVRSPSTISVAVVGSDGSAVASSFSAGYGSGVIPKGTGMLMNNSLGEIELVGDGAGEHPPGDRMPSNMAPTVARSRDDVLAMGSPGADRITSAITISLVRALLGGDDLARAIDHPRVHPVLGVGGDQAAAERGLNLDSLRVPIRWYREPHMYFGGVAGAALVDGTLVAHADPRRTGSATLAG